MTHRQRFCILGATAFVEWSLLFSLVPFHSKRLHMVGLFPCDNLRSLSPRKGRREVHASSLAESHQLLVTNDSMVSHGMWQ